MNFRTFRLFAAVFALTASLSLLSSPLAADGGGFCEKCVHNCPEGELEEKIACFYLCGIMEAGAVCGEHEDCNGNPSRPNLLVCQEESPD